MPPWVLLKLQGFFPDDSLIFASVLYRQPSEVSLLMSKIADAEEFCGV
jgi:hypothetical protein